MSILNEVRFLLNEEGEVETYAPSKYIAIEGIFDNLGRVRSVWVDALERLGGAETEGWGVDGDAYSMRIERDRVIFFNQFQDDETVQVSRDEAKRLIKNFLDVAEGQSSGLI